MAFDLAGTTMFLFGHSPYFGWGVTEGPRFVADCYRVETDPAAPRRFLFDGVPQEMTVVPYEIAVKGAASVRGTFEYTHHNGVLSPVEAREGTAAYVVSYVSAERVGLEAGEYYSMAKARTRAELEAALEKRNVYPANLVIGGADGTIMYIRPGRVPIRAPRVDVQRTFDGNTSATAWRGIYTYAQALKLINPDQGYISNSNVSPDSMYPDSPLRPADYPAEFAFEAGQTNTRQQRLIELLGQAAKLSVDGAKAIAMDETITVARSWAPAFAEVLRARADLLAQQPAEVRPFLEELARFDGVFSKESRGALYHTALRRVLSEKHLDQMGALSDAIESSEQLTPTQQQQLVQAAVEARESLLAAYGRVELAYGDVHKVGRGGVSLPIGGAVVAGAVTRKNTPGPAQTALAIPSVTRVASVRALGFVTDPATKTERLIGGERVPFVVHFATQGVQSYAQTLWGVSDVPSSPHYSDQADLASRKALRPIPLSVAALERDGATETVLTIRAD
jgi:acyl-homoserine lactone acylase PvdQ